VARPDDEGAGTNPAFLPTGATSFIAGVLTYGTDFTADVSPDVDSAGKILRITPLKPLDFSTGPAVNDSGPNIGKVLNVGYLVVLTDGLRAIDLSPWERIRSRVVQVRNRPIAARSPTRY